MTELLWSAITPNKRILPAGHHGDRLPFPGRRGDAWKSFPKPPSWTSTRRRRRTCSACCVALGRAGSGPGNRGGDRRLAAAGRDGRRFRRRFYAPQVPSFRAPHASFQEIEELLLVKGVTPDIFYGTYVPGRRTRRSGAAPGAARPGWSIACRSSAPADRVDVNTASPAVLAAVGLPPLPSTALVERRRGAVQQHAARPSFCNRSGVRQRRCAWKAIPSSPCARRRGCACPTAALRPAAHGGRAGEVHAAGLRFADPHSALVRHRLEQLTRMPRRLSPSPRIFASCWPSAPASASKSAPPTWKWWRRGCGPPRIHVLGRLAIANYAARPAAEWGAEYARFLKSLGVGHLSATVLLPRRDVIVRQVALPGVAPKDIEGAIRLPVGLAAPVRRRRGLLGLVAAGIRRGAGGDRAAQPSSTATCSCSPKPASRSPASPFRRPRCMPPSALNGQPRRQGFVALSRSAAGAVEVYGESASRPVFSAEFDLPPRARRRAGAFRTAAAARDRAAARWKQLLPKPARQSGGERSFPQRTAVRHGAGRGLSPAGAVGERAAAGAPPLQLARGSSFPPSCWRRCCCWRRARCWLFADMRERRYLARAARRDRAPGAAGRARRRARSRDRAACAPAPALLDQFRGQTRADLDALNELTQLVEPPAWTNAIDLTRDSARITGEAPQAAPAAEDPGFVAAVRELRFSTMDPRRRRTEMFQIRTNREARPMNGGTLDRRSVLLLACVVVSWCCASWSAGDNQRAPVVARRGIHSAGRTAPGAAAPVAATVPGKEAVLKQADGRTGRRAESGLIEADTAPQAQAQLST